MRVLPWERVGPSLCGPKATVLGWSQGRVSQKEGNSMAWAFQRREGLTCDVISSSSVGLLDIRPCGVGFVSGWRLHGAAISVCGNSEILQSCPLCGLWGSMDAFHQVHTDTQISPRENLKLLKGINRRGCEASVEAGRWQPLHRWCGVK